MTLALKEHFTPSSYWQSPFVPILCLIVILIGVLMAYVGLRPNDFRIQKAEESYRMGETARSVAERQEAFNNSLSMYLQMESTYNPRLGNGRLYFDIGNTYFQLEQYPWAILYYLKAESLMPRDEVVKHNLALARAKLDIALPENTNFFNDVLFHSNLSIPEYLQIFFLLSLILLFLISGWIWTKKHAFLSSTIILSSFMCLFLIYLGILRYFSPVEAVMVHAAELRRDAGTSFAKVIDQPVPAGSVVEVVSASPDQAWLKVAVADGDFGYVPQDAVRSINY